MSQNQTQRPVIQQSSEVKTTPRVVESPRVSLEELAQTTDVSQSSDASQTPFRDFRYNLVKDDETIVIGNEIYQVQEILGKNEGQTFLGIDSKGKKKKVKLIQTSDDSITVKENGVEETILLTEERKARRERLEARLRKASTVLDRDIDFVDISATTSLDLAIVNDYIDGRNLKHSLGQSSKNLTQYQASKFLSEILVELSKIQKHGVLHGDITPANIIVDLNGNYHLTDYGLSLIDKTDGNLTITSSLRRTPNYVKEIKPAHKMTSADDLYSLARTAIFALSGKETEYQVGSEVEKYDKARVENLAVDPQFKQLLLKMMGYAPKKTVLQKVKDALIVNDIPDVFQTAEQVLKDLRKMTENETQSVAISDENVKTIDDVVDSKPRFSDQFFRGLMGAGFGIAGVKYLANVEPERVIGEFVIYSALTGFGYLISKLAVNYSAVKINNLTKKRQDLLAKLEKPIDTSDSSGRVTGVANYRAEPVTTLMDSSSQYSINSDGKKSREALVEKIRSEVDRIRSDVDKYSRPKSPEYPESPKTPEYPRHPESPEYSEYSSLIESKDPSLPSLDQKIITGARKNLEDDVSKPKAGSKLLSPYSDKLKYSLKNSDPNLIKLSKENYILTETMEKNNLYLKKYLK